MSVTAAVQLGCAELSNSKEAAGVNKWPIILVPVCLWYTAQSRH